MSANKVILVGKVGAVPHLTYSKEKIAISVFHLATETSEKSVDSGQWEQVTVWHRIVSMGKLAEHCANYLNRDMTVYLEGSLHSEKWQDSDGKTRYSSSVMCSKIQFLNFGEKEKESETTAPKP